MESLPNSIVSKIFLYLETPDANLVKTKAFQKKLIKKQNLYTFMENEFNWFHKQYCNENAHYPCSMCKENYIFNQNTCNQMKYFKQIISHYGI
tara:strand:- start:755 stop:1033 length:279 start_codon:yes stop_codon:yes gene_type:complete